MTTVTTVLGALPRVQSMKDALSSELPRFDQGRLEELHTLCLALSFAQANASPPPSLSAEELTSSGAQGSALRDKLLRDGLYLGSYKLIDGRRLADIKSQPGYRTIATDLLTLASVFEENWTAITGKTLVTRDEIDQALALARRLLQGVGERDSMTASMGETAQLRQRAFTLLVQSYDQVRRAVTYLLWDDAEQIEVVCPSLYGGQRGKRSSKEAPEPTPDAKASPDGKASTADSAHDHAASPFKPVIPGQPGGSPFIS